MMDVNTKTEVDDNFSLNISSEPLTKKVKHKPKAREEFGSSPHKEFVQQKPKFHFAKNAGKEAGEFDSGFSDLHSVSYSQQEKIKPHRYFEKKESQPNSSEVIKKEKQSHQNFIKKETKSKPSLLQKQDRLNQNVWSPDKKKFQISSLFHSNPEIPELALSKSTGKSELLFSNKTFEDLDLHPHLVSCLQSRFNVTKVTEVQGHTIPALLRGKDALVKSCTGSGKTISYAVPVVQKLQEIRPKIQRSDGIAALVILPTRELALQSFECFSKLTNAFTWIVPGYLIGGEKKKSEKARIRKGINILISTPGRLLDHLEHTSNLNLKSIQWLIIDEADKLLEEGFEESVLKIMSYCSPKGESAKQTVLLSATLSKGVEKLAGMSLDNPEYIDIANVSGTMEDLVIPSQLKQYVIVTPTKLRLMTLSAFLVDKCTKGDFKALIFMCTQNNVDFHFTLFNQMLKLMLKAKGHRIKFFRLHGNMKQEDRTEIFKRFKAIQSGILLCTDVAARGLDLPHVDWILQYSAPTSAENYVHRVGRTARIGEKGQSLLFLIPSEIKFMNLLQKHRINMDELFVKEILQSLLLIADVIHETPKRLWGMKAVEEHATALQFKYEELVYSDQELYNIAKDAFLSFVQAYSSYPKPLRPMIPFKLLHLGHVAKSFCLRESPSELGCKFSNPPRPRNFGPRHEIGPRHEGIKKRKQITEVSEFDSGLSLWKSENPPLKKKKKS